MAMKKGVRIAVTAVTVIAVALVVLLVTLPLTICPIVKGAALAGEKVVGVPIKVGNVSMNPFNGSFSMSKVSVGNPQGYSTNACFAVDHMSVKMKMASLFSDTIVIDDITIKDPLIRYESKGGKSNFDAFTSGSKPKTTTDETGKETPKSDESGKKVVINHFKLSGAQVQFSSPLTMGAAVPVPTPDIELNGIGAKNGGITAVEAIKEIVSSVVVGIVKASANVVGGATDLVGSGAKDIGAGVKKMATGAVEGFKNLLKSADKPPAGNEK
ncbi:MAG: AsmA family protein [Kiritimatiellae bacterium]|nr:AsmA family protein [Kiritimatiellia bacterium]